MAKTLLELLAGEDMEGGESFCDDVYNFLKNQGKDINLLTNSGFGVWSQSDANKGLATLTFVSGSVEPVVGETMTGATSTATGKVISVDVTGGTWGGTNASGTIELGAVTGTFQDTEDVGGGIGGGNMLTVDGDKLIGMTNDPCNNDDTADWHTDGTSTTFDTDHYEIAAAAANKAFYKDDASLIEGHIYKIELDVKDGAVAAGVDFRLYFYDGVVLGASPIETSQAGWTSYTATFEATATTAIGRGGIFVIGDLATNDIEIKNFSLYEITPCCTGADALAFDDWYKDGGGLHLYREHKGSNTKDGMFYALKIVPTDINFTVQWGRKWFDKESFIEQFEGQVMTIAAYVKASVANHVRLAYHDGSWHYSNYHTGGGNYEWLELTFTLGTGLADVILFVVRCEAAPNVDGSTIVYVSQDMAVKGSSIGEGMYQPRLQEIVYVEKKIVSNTLVGTGFGTVAIADLNLETDSDAMLPKGCRAILIDTTVRDSGSAGAGCFLYFRADATVNAGFINRPHGKVGDTWSQLLGWVKCDSDGDLQYEIIATGGATFDINDCNYLAVQVN